MSQISKLTNIFSAAWSHFETTDSTQIVIARLPNNPKILDLHGLFQQCHTGVGGGGEGGRLKIKNILQIQVFINACCLKGFLLDLAFVKF